jgi:hypothetical protein
VDLPEANIKCVMLSMGSLISTTTTSIPPCAINASLISSCVRRTLKKEKKHLFDILTVRLCYKIKLESLRFEDNGTHPCIMGMISAVSAAPSLGGTQFQELFSSSSPSLMDVLVEFAVFKDMSLIIFDAFAKKGVSSNGTPDDSDE